MRVLLVNDDPYTTHMIAMGLRKQSYAVDVVDDGERTLGQVEATEYDALILDLAFQNESLSVCRAVRKSEHFVPILLLTSRGVESRIEALESGADGYLVKPYDFEELLARLRALIRRGARRFAHARLDVGDVSIYPDSHRIEVRNQEVRLTAKEYVLLEFLARRVGETVSRKAIAEHVWREKSDSILKSNVIDAYIRRLRFKLDVPGHESLIRTRWRFGYQLVGRHRV